MKFCIKKEIKNNWGTKPKPNNTQRSLRLLIDDIVYFDTHINAYFSSLISLIILFVKESCCTALYTQSRRVR